MERLQMLVRQTKVALNIYSHRIALANSLC